MGQYRQELIYSNVALPQLVGLTGGVEQSVLEVCMRACLCMQLRWILMNPTSKALAYGTLAGKVHGSLARAGKVRGQTPKVPKQEKKKKQTGRAMKRIKYNRRFVNVGE